MHCVNGGSDGLARECIQVLRPICGKHGSSTPSSVHDTLLYVPPPSHQVSVGGCAEKEKPWQLRRIFPSFFFPYSAHARTRPPTKADTREWSTFETCRKGRIPSIQPLLLSSLRYTTNAPHNAPCPSSVQFERIKFPSLPLSLHLLHDLPRKEGKRGGQRRKGWGRGGA